MEQKSPEKDNAYIDTRFITKLMLSSPGEKMVFFNKWYWINLIPR